MKHPKSYDTTPKVSRRMARVRLRRGRAETSLARALWHRGYRYRLNDRRLPGSPDIAITRHRLAIFIDGEFWHGYDWQRKKDRLKSNRGYWTEKIEENIARDARDEKRLAALGWTVLRFWEKQVLRDLDACVATVEDAILEKVVEDKYDNAPPPDEG